MNKDRVRVQFDFSEEALERLSALQERVEVSTRTEVIKNSLWLYEWLVGKAEEGEKLVLSAGDLRYLTRLKGERNPKATERNVSGIVVEPLPQS